MGGLRARPRRSCVPDPPGGGHGSPARDAEPRQQSYERLAGRDAGRPAAQRRIVTDEEVFVVLEGAASVELDGQRATAATVTSSSSLPECRSRSRTTAGCPSAALLPAGRRSGAAPGRRRPASGQPDVPARRRLTWHDGPTGPSSSRCTRTLADRDGRTSGRSTATSCWPAGIGRRRPARSPPCSGCPSRLRASSPTRWSRPGCCSAGRRPRMPRQAARAQRPRATVARDGRGGLRRPRAGLGGGHRPSPPRGPSERPRPRRRVRHGGSLPAVRPV